MKGYTSERENSKLLWEGVGVGALSGLLLTRPVTRQDSSPDIAYFVSGKLCDLNFDMTWGGKRGLGIALCKIFIKPKMNQFGDKFGK